MSRHTTSRVGFDLDPDHVCLARAPAHTVRPVPVVRMHDEESRVSKFEDLPLYGGLRALRRSLTYNWFKFFFFNWLYWFFRCFDFGFCFCFCFGFRDSTRCRPLDIRYPDSCLCSSGAHAPASLHSKMQTRILGGCRTLRVFREYL